MKSISRYSILYPPVSTDNMMAIRTSVHNIFKPIHQQRYPTQTPTDQQEETKYKKKTNGQPSQRASFVSHISHDGILTMRANHLHRRRTKVHSLSTRDGHRRWWLVGHRGCLLVAILRGLRRRRITSLRWRVTSLRRCILRLGTSIPRSTSIPWSTFWLWLLVVILGRRSNWWLL